MKYFNIPGFYDHLDLNKFFIRLQSEHPEYFYEDIKIASVFGNFHFCPWDGGRNFLYYNKQQTKEEIIRIADLYNSADIPLRLVFTNPTIEADDLHDRYCNMILRELDNGMNEVCVNSEILEEYIRDKYPKYKIVSSTTKRLITPEKSLQELNKDYYQVCLDYDLNHNLEYLESIPMELRHKVEFLSNAICRPHCPIRKQHYYYTGKAQKTWMKEGYDIDHGCNIKHTLTHPSKLGKENNLSLEDLDKYSKMGFKYFKLEGRTIPSSTMFGCYLYYFIKPEAYFEVISTVGSVMGIFVNDPNGPIKGDIKFRKDEEVSVAKNKMLLY